MIPNWYGLVLLSLAAWRTFQLIADDDILDRPRRWLLRLGDEWQQEGDPVPDEYRTRWALFITCPYCAGFWVAVGWWSVWYLEPKWTLVASTPMAISSLVIAASKVLSTEEK